MAALDKGIARRVKPAVERFADTGAGNVKDSGRRPARVSPPRRRLSDPVSIRFHLAGETVLVRRVRNRREAYR